MSDSDYYCRRIEQETQRARTESDPRVRHVHQTLAQLYRIRLRGELRREANALSTPASSA